MLGHCMLVDMPPIFQLFILHFPYLFKLSASICTFDIQTVKRSCTSQVPVPWCAYYMQDYKTLISVHPLFKPYSI